MTQKNFPDFLTHLGFCDFAITTKTVPSSYHHFANWIEKKQHEPLKYLTGERGEMRRDLKAFFPQMKCALVLLYPYDYYLKVPGGPNVAHYSLAFGENDYHYELREKLAKIINYLQKTYPGLEGKIAVDTHPLLERDLAYQSGLGWFGKNAMLISRKHGSYTLISEILFSQDLSHLLPLRVEELDHCGHCTRCITACPTGAIDGAARTLNAAKCISTATIESKVLPLPSGYNQSNGEIFGCDICQDVCPWNHKLQLRPQIRPTLSIPLNSINFYQQLSQKKFAKLMRGKIWERPGVKGWMKNITSYLKNFALSKKPPSE